MSRGVWRAAGGILFVTAFVAVADLGIDAYEGRPARAAGWAVYAAACFLLGRLALRKGRLP